MFADLLIKAKLEPARVVATISALIALAVAFGLELSNEQIGSIMAVVVLLAGEAIRGKVSPAVPIDLIHEAEVA